MNCWHEGCAVGWLSPVTAPDLPACLHRAVPSLQFCAMLAWCAAAPAEATHSHTTNTYPEADPLANIKSAEKRWRQSLKRRSRNRMAVSTARTFIRDTVRGLRAGEADPEKLKKAVIALDKAAEKGIIHKNNAARRKSRLMSQFAVVAAGGVLPPVERAATRVRTARDRRRR